MSINAPYFETCQCVGLPKLGDATWSIHEYVFIFVNSMVLVFSWCLLDRPLHASGVTNISFVHFHVEKLRWSNKWFIYSDSHFSSIIKYKLGIISSVRKKWPTWFFLFFILMLSWISMNMEIKWPISCDFTTTSC